VTAHDSERGAALCPAETIPGGFFLRPSVSVRRRAERWNRGSCQILHTRGKRQNDCGLNQSRHWCHPNVIVSISPNRSVEATGHPSHRLSFEAALRFAPVRGTATVARRAPQQYVNSERMSKGAHRCDSDRPGGLHQFHFRAQLPMLLIFGLMDQPPAVQWLNRAKLILASYSGPPKKTRS